MTREFEVNERIRKKIMESNLEEPMKEFLLKILKIEFREGKGSRYSDLYKKEIDKAYILLRREK